MRTYYTYAYLRIDGTPYYIGKGTGYRAFQKSRCTPKPPKDRILFLKVNLTEEEAFKHEVYMIALFGRKDLGTGILRNLTNGGEGTSGRLLSDETKKKMSKSALGLPVSQETRDKIAESVSGFKWYNNGVETIQSFEHPGEGWIEGRICTWKSPTSRGMKWYHKDGNRKMFASDPGDGWVRGMPKAKGKKYYNNGVNHVLAYEPPNENWVVGRLRKS
jgi:hypothetical protein